MPVTFAHPAAVLGLRRLPVPLAAMVIGSMVPDVPLFLRWGAGYRASHDPLGVVTVDVLLGMLVLVVWTTCLRDALVDVAPRWVRARLTPRVRLTRREWALAPVGVALGAATHVLWDAFTHRGRWGVRQVEWLRAEHAGLPGASWAQYASGVVGLLVVAAAGWLFLRGRRPQEPPPRVLPDWVVPALAGSAAAGAVASAVLREPAGWRTPLFHAVIGGGQAAAVGLLLLCVLWWPAGRVRRRRLSAAPPARGGRRGPRPRR